MSHPFHVYGQIKVREARVDVFSPTSSNGISDVSDGNQNSRQVESVSNSAGRHSRLGIRVTAVLYNMNAVGLGGSFNVLCQNPRRRLVDVFHFDLPLRPPGRLPRPSGQQQLASGMRF